MKKSVKAKDCYNSVLQFIKTNNIMKAQNENKSENIYSLLLDESFKGNNNAAVAYYNFI